MGIFGTWITTWPWKDKLAQNLTQKPTAKIVNNTDHQGNEDETVGFTYDKIIELLREEAVKSEPISMVANAFAKGTYGSEVNIQNLSDDENANNEYEKFIKIFCKPKEFTLSRQYHFNYWARFAPETYIRDGGFIVRKHKISKQTAQARGYKIPYKIEFIEISKINFEKNDKEKRIYNGVQVNAQNEPIRLHFKGGKHVSFDELILFSKKTRISQLNGVSSIYPSINSIEKQNTHAKAEVDNAIEQAKVSDVYKTNIADTLKIEAQGDFDADLASAGKEVREISSKMPEKDAKIIDIKEEYIRLDRPSYSSAFEVLAKFINTRIAGGSGLTLDEYTNDLSELTFHGGKEATIRNEETYKALRNDMDNLVWIPIFEEMITWCYVLGFVKNQPTDDNKKISLIKKPRTSNQPSQESQAYDRNLANKVMTKGDVVQKISGEPYLEFLKRKEKEEMEEIESEIRLAKKRKELEILNTGVPQDEN